jgi:hypothetical protein
VFERFHRIAGDATTGSGLGLAIAKAVVAHHRGSIVLEDARAHDRLPGLRVRVRLPAGQAAARDAATPRSAVSRDVDTGARWPRHQRGAACITTTPGRVLRRRRSSPR